MRIVRLVACSSMLAATSLAAFARAREGTFPGVQQSIQDRTGKTVRWEVDQAAHEQTLRDVRLLLQKPLTVESAVQIALFSNRSLQATFEEIGLSTADLMEAATIPNPKIDLSVRFPDQPPSVPYVDYSAGIDFLRIIMSPHKHRVAKDHLEAAARHVADEVLELISQVKVAFYSWQASQQLLK